VAGWDSKRPAVRVWACDSGRLHELAAVGAEWSAYGDAVGRHRARRTPAAAWHPHLPLLVVADEDHVAQWTAEGLSRPDGVPAAARYHSLAFSPDGRTLWASPSSGADEDSAWESSDVLDLTSGTVSTGPRWDTGVPEHPAGGLGATPASDQGATFGLFARVGEEGSSAAMRVLRRALTLDADGYETPVFSPDGRHLAIWGGTGRSHRGEDRDSDRSLLVADPSRRRQPARTAALTSRYRCRSAWCSAETRSLISHTSLSTMHMTIFGRPDGLRSPLRKRGPPT
jgi:hypothetical protein